VGVWWRIFRGRGEIEEREERGEMRVDEGIRKEKLEGRLEKRDLRGDWKREVGGETG
jgi:hypothetical protein